MTIYTGRRSPSIGDLDPIRRQSLKHLSAMVDADLDFDDVPVPDEGPTPEWLRCLGGCVSDV